MDGDKYAVLIGNSEFPGEPGLASLACPRNDVEVLNEVLTSGDFGIFDETHVLHDRKHFEINRVLNQVLRNATKDDLVLIYYSGHGKLDAAGILYLAANDTEFDTLESTSVSTQHIHNFINISPASKFILILDCCYSGAVEGAFLRNNLDDTLGLMAKSRGTYIMTASTGIQVAQEKEGDEHGLFTKHLIGGIRGGAPDSDSDGYVTVDELYSYVQTKVRDEGPQSPMKWNLNVRGDLVIAKSGEPAPIEEPETIRQKLLALANENVLPEEILIKSLTVLQLEAGDVTEVDLLYRALLEQFYYDEIHINEFIEEWYRIRNIEVKSNTGTTPELEMELEPEPYPEPEPELYRKIEPELEPELDPEPELEPELYSELELEPEPVREMSDKEYKIYQGANLMFYTFLIGGIGIVLFMLGVVIFG